MNFYMMTKAFASLLLGVICISFSVNILDRFFSIRNWKINFLVREVICPLILFSILGIIFYEMFSINLVGFIFTIPFLVCYLTFKFIYR
jgi:hypothetical protein